ncbi:MAG: nucleotidyltransferase domain-containing protein [Clostridia bacterium]|nr:nucleotidyltransferase domain-containing protein [Clostridia bacterium]
MVYTIDELKNIIGDIAKQYGVKKVALFGSYSTGEETPDSDVDLLIDKGEIKGLFMFNSFVTSVQERLNKDVDVITYNSLNRSLIKDTVKNEVVLYEQ